MNIWTVLSEIYEYIVTDENNGLFEVEIDKISIIWQCDNNIYTQPEHGIHIVYALCSI